MLNKWTKLQRKTFIRRSKKSKTRPDVQFNDFSLTKQKLDLERTMSELGKNISKKNQLKNIKNKKSMSKCHMWIKQLVRNGNLEKN